MGVDGDQDIWFQPIYMLLPKCVWLQGPSSAPAGKRWVSPIAEGPTELRAPGPRDPTIRHCTAGYLFAPNINVFMFILWPFSIVQNRRTDM